MSRLLIGLCAALLAAPALAQHGGHGAPPPAGDPGCTPEHAAMGHCQPPPSTPHDPHPGHSQHSDAAPAVDPHAGHPEAEAGHHPHATHIAAGRRSPQEPPPPAAYSGPEHAADDYFHPSEMAAARERMRREHGGLAAYKLLVDRLEARVRGGADGYVLDAEGWYGGDIDKLWIKAEAEGEFGDAEEVEVQALWSHAIDPWFDLQAGLRQDLEGAGRTHAVLGIQGLAPYWFEVDGALFLSDKGDVTARFEAEYDLRITQRLILQPRLQVDVSAQTIAGEGIGAGVVAGEGGMRLRYEISPQFAPYLGVAYERAVGKTRRLRRLAGQDLGGARLVLGVRAWF